MQPTVLILGARGRFGLAAARAFADAGWRVLGLVRPGAQLPPEAATDQRIEWLVVDLQDSAAVVRAAHGACVVVHALNPLYTRKAWKTQAQPMAEAAIGITRALGATLMFIGNVYNFGADMPALLAEDTPQRARTAMGQVRIAVEAQIRRSGVRAIVIRAGDFFGSGTGTWFDQAMVKDIQKGKFVDPGRAGVAKAWAYLPDLARTFVEVALRRDALPPFEVFHFAGYSITGQHWLDAIDPVALAQRWVEPGAALQYSRLPWPFIRIGALFSPTFAASLDLRYLWTTPHALDNRKLVALLGAEPHRPLVQATAMALHDLGFTRNAVGAQVVGG
ncbi:sugar nucleotide-binding protein [Rhodoferax sp. WC2427]|uniref:sugar nucleotide-binding protein n=1 Tax=Rhodoferax sp. WC2427 TaxID=3234144 RepID=UPI00346743F5